jgi:purine-nucleoside phosphorylase
MSSAHEAVVAIYCGIKVFGFSIVTDLSPSQYDQEKFQDHEEIVKVANLKAKDAEKLISLFLKNILNDMTILD